MIRSQFSTSVTNVKDHKPEPEILVLSWAQTSILMATLRQKISLLSP